MTSLTSHAPLPLQPLCDSRGRLLDEAIGWSNRPQVDCTLHGHAGRRKRWNHWCITTPQWMLSLTLADLDYLGYGAAYFLDLESGQAVAHAQFRPFALGCQLPDLPLESHAFSHSPATAHRRAPGRLRLTAAAPDIGGQPLQVALDIQRPAHLQSVNLVAPLQHGGFHATCRQLGLPTAGSLQLGGKHYSCVPGQSFAALDFGRGVWPLNTYWQRAAFAAAGGIAGNFGAGWLDHSGLSENSLWFGGEVQLLDSPLHIERSSQAPLAPGAWTAKMIAWLCASRPANCTRPAPSSGPFTPAPYSASVITMACCAA